MLETILLIAGIIMLIQITIIFVSLAFALGIVIQKKHWKYPDLFYFNKMEGFFVKLFTGEANIVNNTKICGKCKLWSKNVDTNGICMNCKYDMIKQDREIVAYRMPRSQ